MVGRMYVAAFDNAGLAAYDLLEINAPSDAIVKVHAFVFSQAGVAGDENNGQINLLVHRATTSGQFGLSLTANPVNVGDPAFGGSIELENGLGGDEGTIVFSESFNIMAGIEKYWRPGERLVISPSGRLVFELQTTIAGSPTGSGAVWFEELG